MKYYTAPEGVWLPVDEESILATENSRIKNAGNNDDDRWGILYPING